MKGGRERERKRSKRGRESEREGEREGGRGGCTGHILHSFDYKSNRYPPACTLVTSLIFSPFFSP